MNWSSSSDDRVGPMKIVQDDDHRSPPSRVVKHRGHRHEQTVASVVGPIVEIRRTVANAQLWGEPSELGQLVRSEALLENLPGVLARELPHDLDPWPETRRLVSVPTRCPDSGCARHRGVLDQTAEQRRLADARLTGQQHESEATSKRPVDHRLQARQGPFSPDEARAEDDTIRHTTILPRPAARPKCPGPRIRQTSGQLALQDPELACDPARDRKHAVATPDQRIRSERRRWLVVRRVVQPRGRRPGAYSRQRAATPNGPRRPGG